MHLNSLLRGTGLVALVVAVVGFAASIAQLWTLGLLGRVTAVVVPVAVVMLVVKAGWPTLRRNRRGDRLINSIAELGLRDLEMRGYGTNHLPSVDYLVEAKRDVLVVGPTLYGMVERHTSELTDALRRGVAVRLLILDPGWAREAGLKARVDIPDQIHATLALLRNAGLSDHRALSVRFVRSLPPYRGVMVDADASPLGDLPATGGGWLRVQPHLACDIAGHQAMVAEFAATRTPASPFHLFADDLRKLWIEATERRDLL